MPKVKPKREKLSATVLVRMTQSAKANAKKKKDRNQSLSDYFYKGRAAELEAV